MNRSMKRCISGLRDVFSKREISKLASETNFIKRKRKMTGEIFLKLCIFNNDGLCKKSLSYFCSKILLVHGVKVTTEGLNNRFDGTSVEFLKKFLKHVLRIQSELTLSGSNKSFSPIKRINIMDSTIIELNEKLKHKYSGKGGGASEASAKMNLEFDLLSGEFLDISLHSGTRGDCDCMYDDIYYIRKGDLYIRDLGYLSTYELEIIQKREAYFISKIKSNTLIYSDKPENMEFAVEKKDKFYKLDLSKMAQNMSLNEIRSFKDIIIGKTHPIKCTLIIAMVPDEVKEDRRRNREKEAKKKKVKNSSSALDGINVYITNIPQNIISSEAIFKFYSLRWQIEIMFKTWKSIYEIDMVNDVKEERFECFVYGKFIEICLSTILLSLSNDDKSKIPKEISLYKAHDILHNYNMNLQDIVFKESRQIYKEISVILEALKCYAKRCIRKGRLKVATTISSIEGLTVL
jgi:hypothetical protein